MWNVNSKNKNQKFDDLIFYLGTLDTPKKVENIKKLVGQCPGRVAKLKAQKILGNPRKIQDNSRKCQGILENPQKVQKIFFIFSLATLCPGMLQWSLRQSYCMDCRAYTKEKTCRCGNRMTIPGKAYKLYAIIVIRPSLHYSTVSSEKKQCLNALNFYPILFVSKNRSLQSLQYRPYTIYLPYTIYHTPYSLQGLQYRLCVGRNR